jgi:hypothetical protein
MTIKKAPTGAFLFSGCQRWEVYWFFLSFLTPRHGAAQGLVGRAWTLRGEKRVQMSEEREGFLPLFRRFSNPAHSQQKGAARRLFALWMSQVEACRFSSRSSFLVSLHSLQL